MYCKLLIACMATLVVAAPVEMAGDVVYAGYKPYGAYGSYGTYGESAEAKANMMETDAESHTKRVVYGKYDPYTTYGAYTGGKLGKETAKMEATKRDMMMHDAGMMSKDMEESMANENTKRHMMHDNIIEKEMLDSSMAEKNMVHDQDTTQETKRDMPALSEMVDHKQGSTTLPDNWYGKYNPYSDYGSYSDEVGEQA
ncbi:hypothetical protein ACN47E_003278 [Coniothyrium glycines]